jgi:nitrate reductase gamma subunit
MRAFCLSCHQQEECTRTAQGQEISLKLDNEPFADEYHQYVACNQCHQDLAKTPHASDGADCTGCHQVHGDEQAGAPHLNVSCQSCHLTYDQFKVDKDRQKIVLSSKDETGQLIGLTAHEMDKAPTEQEKCNQCHFEQNKLGAPSSALPGKSILCIGCHNSPATLNAGGSGFLLFFMPLAIAVLGLIGIFTLWFRGAVHAGQNSFHDKITLFGATFWGTVFSRKFLALLKTLVLDILLQRRILLEGVQRWSIHSLIFHAFLARLLISLLGLVSYYISPDSSLTMALLDKNHPFVAVAYDLLGLMIIIGVVWACIQRFIARPAHMTANEQDIVSLIIIGLLVASGFLLEGSRLLITQFDANAAYSFAGFILSKLMAVFPVDWQNGFVWLWYLHAVLWGVFLIYLPFGKLKHIIFTPLNLLFNVGSGESETK